eukprot:c1898_g1_i1 orf=1-201(-)
MQRLGLLLLGRARFHSLEDQFWIKPLVDNAGTLKKGALLPKPAPLQVFPFVDDAASTELVVDDHRAG